MTDYLDNYDNIAPRLTFEKPGDFYVVHVLVRAKDVKDTEFYHDGAKEGQRLVKTFYIDSLGYFEKKYPQIKELAKANHARAYFFPQVRNRLDCNRELAKAIISDIDNTQIKYDRLVRTAVCGCHKSRASRWVLDIDWEEGMSLVDKASVLGKHRAEVKQLLALSSKYSADDVYGVPSPHGYSLVTPPFDRSKFSKPDIIKKDAMVNLYCAM